MARIKKFSIFLPVRQAGNFQFSKKHQRWVRDKIKEIRKITKPQAKRLQRLTKKFGSLGIVTLIAGSLITSFFLPKDKFQLTKERLIKNPNDLEAQLILAKEFLKNNQFEEAEKILKIAQFNPQSPIYKSEIEKLWQKKHYSDPKDIKILIKSWEEIIEKYPNYRDGYLQLAYLYAKISQKEKSKEVLNKALELDPNFEVSQKLEKFLR